ncbi:MAG: amino acid--tRNA ligase-related protein, partial [bacterium]|nr:amino acid--tRNA ligase-related protein [bacterium]
DSAPGACRARAYDLALNGVEIAGGSIRINDQDLQRRMFEKLGINKVEAESRFGFLLKAFRYGVPPHGGIAFGMERLIMAMRNITAIRDLIAFPKTTTASCLMAGAPSSVDDEQLKELGIKLR